MADSTAHDTAPVSDPFREAVESYRASYTALRKRSNFCSAVLDIDTEREEGHDVQSVWFEDGTPLGRYVRLADRPGTLSGDILRLRRDLPSLERHFDIDSDIINIIATPPPHPLRDDDTEDISAELAQLPLVQVDPSKHFVKKGKYRSEVHNLLKCQGGACPGTRLSSRIVQLLGKSHDGQLVFEKLLPRYLVLYRFCSMAIYKRWILDLIEGVRFLHSQGIVHRDLYINNLLFSENGERLIVGDLECRWGQRSAPEILRIDSIDSGWTEKSDIYDIGLCIRCLIYTNVPATHQVEWPVPPPFESIVEACTRALPEQRPSLDELARMVEEGEFE